MAQAPGDRHRCVSPVPVEMAKGLGTSTLCPMEGLVEDPQRKGGQWPDEEIDAAAPTPAEACPEWCLPG